MVSEDVEGSDAWEVAAPSDHAMSPHKHKQNPGRNIGQSFRYLPHLHAMPSGAEYSSGTSLTKD